MVILRAPQPNVSLKFVQRADGESLLDSGAHLRHRKRLHLRCDCDYYVILRTKRGKRGSFINLEAFWPAHSEIQITDALRDGLQLQNGGVLVAQIMKVYGPLRLTRGGHG